MKMIHVTALAVLFGSAGQAHGFVPRYRADKPVTACTVTPESADPFAFPRLQYSVEAFRTSPSEYELKVIDRSQVLPDPMPQSGVVVPITKNETIFESAVKMGPNGKNRWYWGDDIILSLDAPTNAGDDLVAAELTYALFGQKKPVTCQTFDRFPPKEKVEAVLRCGLRVESQLGGEGFDFTFFSNERGEVITQVMNSSLAGYREVASFYLGKIERTHDQSGEIREASFKNSLFEGTVDFTSVDQQRNYKGQVSYTYYDTQYDFDKQTSSRVAKTVTGEARCTSYEQLPQDTGGLRAFMTGRGPLVNEASVDRLRAAIADLNGKGLIDSVSPESPFGFEGGSEWCLGFSGDQARTRLHEVYNALKTVEFESRSTDYQVWTVPACSKQ